MYVKCPECNTDNTQDSQFCKNCAAPLASGDTAKITRTKTLHGSLEQLTTGAIFAKRYQVIEELGQGGMGKVYRVMDRELNEEVALKLIRPEIATSARTLDRFRNELRHARKISHKNVGRMYELMEYEGTYFITMEYIPGQDLKSLIKQTGKQTLDTTVSIAKEICEGLSEAHRMGIIHRDLKPSNIMIDKQGDAKIMDFGIARSLESKGITGAGMMIGTPEYMSPEQVEGEEADQRSDIYSLGVIIYEMVTGRVPFEGDTPLSVAYKHKNTIPQNPNEIIKQIPDDLSLLIMKCLEKEKEKRYQHAEEVRSELENIEKDLLIPVIVLPERKKRISKIYGVESSLRKASVLAAGVVIFMLIALAVWLFLLKKQPSPSLSGDPVIAVLPFSDLSPEQNQEYFCEGMTEEIIAKLSQLQGWKVMAKTSVMQYKATAKNIKDIGQELNVTSILEGSIRKEKDDIRITAQLINVEDGFHLWSETYDRKLNHIFTIQNDIAENIVNALKQKLTPSEKERLQKKTTENLEAYNLYLQGRYFWGQRTKEGMRKSLQRYQQALELDPNYALSWSGIADCYIAGGGRYLDLAAKEAYPKAKAAASKALEIDNTLAQAHNSLAGLLTSFYWDWERAEDEFKQALELNPNYSTAHIWYAEHLWSMGHHEESIRHANIALELDPLSLMTRTVLGIAFHFAGQYDQALQQYQSTLEIDPDFQEAHHWLGRTYAQVGNFAEAIENLQMANRLSGGEPGDKAVLGYAYALAGKHKEAEEMLSQLKSLSNQRYVSPVDLAMLCTGLDEKNEAIEWLEKAYEERAERFVYLKVNPEFNPLRKDSRFQNLMGKMDYPY
ncbi:MAG: protein kinase [Candidatus Aminicenantes bacterium]|nr:protein kinase [Candidatus Aminicenantes bacterium]